MTFQEIPQLVEKVRKTYPVSDVEVKFSSENCGFAVRVDVCISISGNKVECSTCWHEVGFLEIDDAINKLFQEIKSEMTFFG